MPHCVGMDNLLISMHPLAGNVLVVRPVGPLTTDQVWRLETVLLAVDPWDTKGVALEVTAVQDIDSTGIKMLVDFAKAFKENGCDFAVYCPSDEIANVFKIAGVDKLLPIRHWGHPRFDQFYRGSHN